MKGAGARPTPLDETAWLGAHEFINRRPSQLLVGKDIHSEGHTCGSLEGTPLLLLIEFHLNANKLTEGRCRYDNIGEISAVGRDWVSQTRPHARVAVGGEDGDAQSPRRYQRKVDHKPT